MSTTFTQHHIVHAGKEMLAFSCRVPDGWHITPLPDDEYNFENPTVFVPLLIAMAPYGAVLFTVAARPKFDDGSVQDWAEYLCAQNNLVVSEMHEARIGRVPCVLCEATAESELGVMRSRSLFLEDGGRLFNIQALAPREIWPSVEATFSQLLGSFVLDEVKGMSAQIMREMVAGDRVEFAFVDDVPAVSEEPKGPARKDIEVWTYAEDPPEAPAPEPAPTRSKRKRARIKDEESPRPAQREFVSSTYAEAPPEPPTPEPSPTSGEFAGKPGWWRQAVLLERDNKLEEAEQVIRRALDHIGVYSQIAYLYEERVVRLRNAGDDVLADDARERAIQWLYAYAGSATSGGEGAALSYERDQRIAALGGSGK
jgi:hypothetical protein